jgi:transcriptional regulator with XRE-family HTH domain
MKKSGLKKDFPSMYNWLSGKYIPNVYNLVRLAKLLDCSVDYLLGRE